MLHCQEKHKGLLVSDQHLITFKMTEEEFKTYQEKFALAGCHLEMGWVLDTPILIHYPIGFIQYHVKVKPDQDHKKEFSEYLERVI